MDNVVQEEEIKIEYDESFETDPLTERNINSLELNIGIEHCHDLCESSQYSRCHLKVKSDKNSIYLNDKTDNDHLGDIKESKVPWYDSIDNSGKFLCKFCDLKYSTLQTLRFHVKTKHPEKANHIKCKTVNYRRRSIIKCHICKQKFKEISTLKTHVMNNHSLEVMKASCLYCDAVFSTENEMSGHLLLQHKKVICKSSYICNICGYRTTRKSHYSQHMNVHVGNKDKKCQYCDYATNCLNNLKVHERTHTKNKVYICDFKNCNYSCSAKFALRSHQLKHNPEDHVLYCDKCSYKTIYKQSLKRHEDCHKRNSIKLKVLF